MISPPSGVGMNDGVRKRRAGTLLVGAVFVMFVLTALLGMAAPRVAFLSGIFLGGFIGGFTNTVAIRMLFERRWYLPGSGVLLKSRQKIIESLAETVEKHVLNTELLEEWLREKLLRVHIKDMRNALNSVLEEFREDLIRYVESGEVRTRLIDAAENVIDRMGFLRHMVRLLTTKEILAARITAHLSAEISRFRFSDAMMEGFIRKVGTLEDLLLAPDNPLMLKHYHSGEAVAGYFLAQLNIKQRVVERLSGYPPEKVAGIVEENIREHLVWLEIFGVILGCTFAGLFEGAKHLLALLPPN